MVAGRQVCRHPSIQQRAYVLQKLLAFHLAHGTALSQTLAAVHAAIEELPQQAYPTEASPLAEEVQRLQERRRPAPQPLRDILPSVLASRGLPAGPSAASGE